MLRTEGDEDEDEEDEGEEENEAGAGRGVGDRDGDILSLFVLPAGGGLEDGLDEAAVATAPLRFSDAAADDASMAPKKRGRERRKGAMRNEE